MTHIPSIQVQNYNQYALCHIETGFFFSLVNLVDWDYLKYRSWRFVFVQSIIVSV